MTSYKIDQWKRVDFFNLEKVFEHNDTFYFIF